MEYRELILDLYKNPANKRVIDDAEITHSGANVTCGDHVRMYVKLAAPIETNGGSQKKAEQKIQDISFEGQGCAISIAAASLLTEEARGKNLDEVMKWNAETICEWLGTDLGPSRMKCGMLCLETMKEGIKKNTNRL